MKKFLCLLAVIMLIFAVSCNSDNPSPDSNIPKPNTDYSDLPPEEQMKIINDFMDIVDIAYDKEYPALEAEILTEISNMVKEDQLKGKVTKSNADNTVTVVSIYEAELTQNGGFTMSSDVTIYINDYVSEPYTIWGVINSDYEEYTFRDKDEISNIRIVHPNSQTGEKPGYSLNGNRVEL